MPKVLHVSFLWDDQTVNQRHSDYILAMGWIKAGWDVLYYDYRMNVEEVGNEAMNSGLIQIIMNENPDIVFFSKSEGASRRFGNKAKSCAIDPNIITKLKNNGFKGLFVHWFLDQRYDYFRSSINLGKHCDWFFYVSTGKRLEQYSKKMNTPASFILAPYEPSFMKPLPFASRRIDLIWMGGSHKPSRNNFEDTRYQILKALISGGMLRDYYGCFDNERVWCPQYQTLLGQSKMGLSLYAFDRPMYFSNRLSHTIGSATAVFSYDFKERERIFSDDEGIFFKDINEFKKKKAYYLTNQDELEWVATNGHKKAKKYFSASNVVNEIIYTLQNGESSLPFGETYNPKKLQYEIPVSNKEYGDVYYIDSKGHTYSIEQYGNSMHDRSPDSKAIIERRQYRADRIKTLHQQKNNVRLTKRAANRKPNIR